MLDEAAARALAAGLEGAPLTVSSMTHKPYRRSPRAPFITSTLQQEAGRKLRFSSKRTMSVAQHLYEEGWITYMRTDSTTLSEQALSAARAQATAMYGPAYVPAAPRHYNKKVKNAQEAHEAIRPAGETFRTPGRGRPLAVRRRAPPLRPDLEAHRRLADGRRHRDQRPGAADRDGHRRRRGPSPSSSAPRAPSSSSRASSGPTWRARTTPRPSWPTARCTCRRWPRATRPRCPRVEPGGHATQPPARYTEASLVKAMEEIGVGRPSTYASIVSTILDRGYVWKKGSAMVPSLTAFGVVGLLEQHFADLVDYGLTASMEDDLDEIAGGDEDMARWLGDFWFGPGGHGGLRDQVADNLDAIDAAAVNAVPIGTAADGQEIVARSGKYGPYLKKGDETVSIPDDLAPDELTVEKAEELLAAPSSDRVLGTDPETGPRRPGQGRPLRPLRPARRAGRRRPQAPHVVAVRLDVPGHAHLRAGARAAPHPPGGRHRPGRRPGDRGLQRQVRPLPEEGDRLPQPR